MSAFGAKADISRTAALGLLSVKTRGFSLGGLTSAFDAEADIYEAGA